SGLKSQIDTLFSNSSFGDFFNASSVSSSRGEFIFVSDLSLNKIFKFDKSGILLTSYGGTGQEQTELNQPVSIDASSGLDVYITDYLNNRLIRLDHNLNFISSFDFNVYNTAIEGSKKIFNPHAVSYLSTGDLFVLSDAGNYKVVRIKNFNNIALYFAQAQDKLLEPVKIVKGNALDMWILEKSTGDLANFNNLGIFVKRIEIPGDIKPVGIAYTEDNLVIVSAEKIFFYDLNAGKFLKSYILPKIQIKDINMLDKETLLVLLKNKVFIYKLNK